MTVATVTGHSRTHALSRRRLTIGAQEASKIPRFLDEHLNVQWLRPESALWDAIASAVVSQFSLRVPSLDLGAGNGVFSFITAGGAFSPDYDWYRNANPQCGASGDLYDAFVTGPTPQWIQRRPAYQIDCALDAKPNLLRQADALGFYHTTVVGDANRRLPFDDETFATVFSNILSWLDSPEGSLREVWRILHPNGHALLCLPDRTFLEWCASYRWKEERSELLRLLNGARRESIRWTVSSKELATLTKRAGFKVVSERRYLSPVTLNVWDIGLRPLSPVLIRLVQRLDEADRLTVKQEWMGILRPFLRELYALDQKDRGRGGYYCLYLKKG